MVTEELLAELRAQGIGVYATGGGWLTSVTSYVRSSSIVRVTCRMKRSDVIDNARIQAGDVIVGAGFLRAVLMGRLLAMGDGGNGLTSARHDVLEHSLSKHTLRLRRYYARWVGHSGSKALTPSLVRHWMRILSYAYHAPIIKAILDELRPEIHGMVHCSGGAQTKVLHFVEGKHVIQGQYVRYPTALRADPEGERYTLGRDVQGVLT